MPRRLSDATRSDIMQALRQGEKAKAICERTGVSVQQVTKMRHNLWEYGSVVPPPSPQHGRPRALDPEKEAKLLEFLDRRPDAYLSQMVQFIHDEFNGTKVSASTLSNTLRRHRGLGWSRNQFGYNRIGKWYEHSLRLRQQDPRANMMRAVDIKDSVGPATSLFINPSVPKPTPRPSDALVKIKCFGLNRMDLLQREGHYPVPPQAGKILGVEFSGVIETLGDTAETAWKVGDEVFGLAYGGVLDDFGVVKISIGGADSKAGAYAEYISVSTHMLIHKPKELSWEEASGIPETWITATQAMYLIGEFAAGKSILWHAGASSVSIAGIQLSKADNAAAIYVTAGSDEKVEFCKSLGATAGFNYNTQDWAKEILRVTDGKGVDVIIDFVGQNYFQGNLDVAARDGRIVTLASLSGTKLPAGVDIGAFVMKRLRFEGSSLRSRDEEYQGKLRNTLAEHGLPKFTSGEFKVPIEKVFPWEEVVQAHQLIESNQTKGKIVCRID